MIKNISVIGANSIGLGTSLALVVVEDVSVTCIDHNDHLVEELKNGTVNASDPALEKAIQRYRDSGRLFFSEHCGSLREADAIVIAIDAFLNESGQPDLSLIFETAQIIGETIEQPRVAVVVKSAVPPGTTEKIRGIINSGIQHRGISCKLEMAAVYEFTRECNMLHDLLSPKGAVVGSDSKFINRIYAEMLVFVPDTIFTDICTAELAQFTHRAALANRVAFKNEMIELAETVGANAADIKQLVNIEQQMWFEQHRTSTIDHVNALARAIAEDQQIDLPLLNAAAAANARQPAKLAHYIAEQLGAFSNIDGIGGKTIGIVGISDAPDSVSGPSPQFITLSQYFGVLGCNVIAFDYRLKYGAGVELADDVLTLGSRSDAVVLLHPLKSTDPVDLMRCTGLQVFDIPGSTTYTQ